MTDTAQDRKRQKENGMPLAFKKGMTFPWDCFQDSHTTFTVVKDHVNKKD
jgi:hypothetical protein